MQSTLPAYAELHCLSSFSFQRGASQPEELVARAAALGYAALAITDECSVAGVVRAHTEAKKQGIRLLLGAEFRVQDPGLQKGAPASQPQDTQADPDAWLRLVVLVQTVDGWGNLCEFITAARSKAAKGSYRVSWGCSDWD